MRLRLDTSILLLEGRKGIPTAPRGPRPSGRALFLVHRAADGWLAFDLAGSVTERFVPRGGSGRTGIDIVRGGDAFPDRILPLYALDRDPESFGGLRVPGPGGVRFGLGGDVEALVRVAVESAEREGMLRPRLRFFRGLSAIRCRSRAAPEGSILVRATPTLVFETMPDELWKEAACPA